MIDIPLLHLHGHRPTVRAEGDIGDLHELVHQPLDMLGGIVPSRLDGGLAGGLVEGFFKEDIAGELGGVHPAFQLLGNGGQHIGYWPFLQFQNFFHLRK